MTTRGRTIAALAASMLVFGRLSGLRELVMAGAAFALVLITGFALVWVRGGKVAVSRTIDPPRTNVGHTVRVELHVEVTGHLGMGPVLLADQIPPDVGPTPRLALPGGTRRRNRAVAYNVAPRLRGRHTIGPLEVTHTDPFGAVRRRQEVAGSSPLLVYPSFEDISVLPSAVQRIGIIRHSPLVGAGDEFYALRAYEEGDDLRKVHWPSSLRKGELVIRQEELLAEPRALIVLDTNATKHRGSGPSASLEAAVSAAASIGILALRRRMRVEVVTNEGPLLHTRHPTEDQLLEGLALVRLSKGSIGKALEKSFRPRSGRPALIVAVTPDLRREDVRAIALRSKNSAAGAIVWIDANSYDAASDRKRRRKPDSHSLVLPFPVITLHSGDSFRAVWQTTIKDVSLAR